MLLVGGIRGAVAQEILEYRWDIGGGLGLCYYLGDVNRTPFSGSSVMTAFTLRRNFNPRMSLKANLAYARYSGTSKGYYLPAITRIPKALAIVPAFLPILPKPIIPRVLPASSICLVSQ